MATTAQRGIFGFGPQSGMEVAATTFYRHRAQNIDLAPIDQVQVAPPEVGGSVRPTFPFKTGVAAAGGARLFPRLENTVGWLLYAATGAVSTLTGDGVGNNPPVGVQRHTFKHASDSGFLPWLSARVLLPGSSQANDQGVLYEDMKVVGLSLILASEAPIAARIDLLGRKFKWEDPSTWTWANAYEAYKSVPLGPADLGYFKIPGFSSTELPVVGATIAFTNAPLDVRQERVYGSPYLEDVTIVDRRVTFDIVVKWKDPTLYRRMHDNGEAGVDWSPQPFVQDIDIVAVSPGNIPGQTVPYKLRIQAAEVMFTPNGPIQLVGGQSIAMRFTGQAIEPSSGEFVTVDLENEVTDYTWP